MASPPIPDICVNQCIRIVRVQSASSDTIGYTGLLKCPSVDQFPWTDNEYTIVDNIDGKYYVKTKGRIQRFYLSWDAESQAWFYCSYSSLTSPYGDWTPERVEITQIY